MTDASVSMAAVNAAMEARRHNAERKNNQAYNVAATSFLDVISGSLKPSIWAGNPSEYFSVETNLAAASNLLALAIESGEFRRLPTKSRTRLRGLSMTLQALADRARDERETPKPDAWWRRFF
jgi:hypothetical protein